MTARPSVRLRPAPAPASGLPDQLDTTARQVRVDGRDDTPVHRLVGEPYTVNGGGRHYRILCGGTLTSFGGAILTTRETDCGRCRGGGRR